MAYSTRTAARFAQRPGRGAQAAAMATPWAWGWVGALIGLLLALTLFAPAYWLTQGLTHAFAGRVSFEQVRGTVWDGSAQVALSGGAGSLDKVALPGRVEWTLRPNLSALDVSLAASCCSPQPIAMQCLPHWGGVQVRLADGVSQWPAELLSGLGTPWNTLQMQGQLQLATQALVLDWFEGRPLVSGAAQIDAKSVSSRLSTLRPIGSYRIQVQGGATTTLQLQTLEGSLKLSGTGQWVGSRLRFDGEASAAPQRLDALSNLLNILGRRDGARSIIKLG